MAPSWPSSRAGERRRAAAAPLPLDRRRRPRLRVLRGGSVLLGVGVGLLAAMQSERLAFVAAQCTGGGLEDDVLCRALGKECGRVLGASLRTHLPTTHAWRFSGFAQVQRILIV